MGNPTSKKILIIDDELDLVKVVRSQLQGSGYQTVAALDGQEGLRLANEIRPALIILDLNLPKLPGEEVCRATREDQDKTFNCTPILMLTAKSGDVDRIIGKVLGADYFLTKPYDSKVFLAKVKELMDR